MGRVPRLQSLDPLLYVHWRIDAGLCVFALLPNIDCEFGLYRCDSPAVERPSLRPCRIDYGACVRSTMYASLTLSGWLSDRAGQRGVFVCGFSLLGLVGFVMCISSASARVGYAGVCE